MWLLAATWVVCASAAFSGSNRAAVYTLETDLRSNHLAPSISFENARLWLTNRLGLSSTLDLDKADTDTISLLNKYGDGSQATLFSPTESRPRKLVIIEGVEHPNEFFEEKFLPSFHISNPPSSWSNAQFVADLLKHDGIQRGSREQCSSNAFERSSSGISGGFSANDPVGSCTLLANANQKSKALADTIDVIRGGAFELTSVSGRQSLPPSITSSYTSIFHVTDLNNIAEENGVDSTAYREALAQVRDASKMQAPEQQITIVCMPRTTNSVKRDADEYIAIQARPNVNMRKEQPLSEPASPSASQPALSSTPANSTIPKTTIPSCYSNEAACISNTASCASHGTCKKRYTEKVSDDEEGPECWACECIPSKIKNGEYVKTIYWGGPACQKKDISVPFFLFAGFTVAAVAAVSYGIGLLYSIGEEDLPSVLGAGVAPAMRK